MGDGDLRALERRWHETGEVEDEARWHVARVRSGALSQDRLDLAAAMGVPGALAAVSRKRPPKPPGSEKGLRAWLGDLELHGAEPVRRAALAVAGLSLAEALRARRRRPPFHPALVRAARAWFDAAIRRTLADDEPSKARLQTVATTLRERHLEYVLAQEDALELRTVVHVADALSYPVCLVASWYEPPPDEQVATIHGAVAAALGPWALKLRDPLAALLESSLDRTEVAAPCPVAWEDMLPTDDPAARRCARCSLDVLDLSSLSRAEAEARLAAARSAGGLCVQLYRAPDGRVLTADCLAVVTASLPPARHYMTRGMVLPTAPEAT